jgi:MOSC domain-containing protein YiiM
VTRLRLLSVNLSLPHVIGSVHGEPVLSGIAKRATAADAVFVGATNITGDGQADLRVHGGIDKAVYAYPSVHWPWWTQDHGLACGPATFGENLTLDGADETEVAIGDRFRWGEALLEISQPRAPCFKLGIHTGRNDIPTRMILSARCGWYFRVLDEGHAPVAGELVREHRSGGPSVREAFVAALHPGTAASSRLRVRDTEALAPAWKRMIR